MCKYADDPRHESHACHLCEAEGDMLFAAGYYRRPLPIAETTPLNSAKKPYRFTPDFDDPWAR
jgi:hypothetical protein